MPLELSQEIDVQSEKNRPWKKLCIKCHIFNFGHDSCKLLSV